MKSKQKRPPYPLSTWEQSIDGKTAQRFLDDTKKIIIRLHEKTGLKKNPFSTPWVAEWEIQQ